MASNTTMTSSRIPEVTIEQLNDLDNDKYVFTVVLLLIVITFGIIGNLTVIYIYKTKFKRSSARVYIISLALADLSVCLAGVPYHVLDLHFSITYPSRLGCQLLSFIIGACTLSSIFILLVVGLDRFLKVCRPLKKQIADFGDRKACIIATVVAVILNIPNGIIYGNSTVAIDGHNISGVECFIDDEYSGSGFATGFLGLNLLIFISSCAYLIVIYALIGKTIYMQAKLNHGVGFDKGNTFRLCCRRSQADDEDDEADLDEVVETNTGVKFDNEEGNEDVTIPKFVVEEYDDNDATENNTGKVTGDMDNPKGNDMKSKGKKQSEKTKNTGKKKIHKISSATIIRHTNRDKAKKEQNTRKITLMMMTITIVFILTYLPFIAMSIVDNMVDDFWGDLSSVEAVLYDGLLRLYLINNVANPLIYGFWDNRFRREVIRLLRKLFCCMVTSPKPDISSSASSSNNVTNNKTVHYTVNTHK